VGRKSTFSETVTRLVLGALVSGKPLTEACRDAGVGVQTIYDWRDTHPDFAVALARARNVGEEVIADNLRLVAAGVEGFSSGDVARDKLMVDTDLKLLAIWNPSRYAPRPTEGGATVNNNFAIVEMAQLPRGRLRALISASDAVDGEGRDSGG